MMTGAARTVALYPWYSLTKSLLFWQAIWFLYFQKVLTPAEAILLYVVYELSVTVLEVPSGYMSDRLGRRRTLICSALVTLGGVSLLAMGNSFAVFALGQALIGAGQAFSSGTDSAVLFESLEAEGRSDEIEAHELKAWRMGYLGFATSAVVGGGLAIWSDTAPFWASAAAAAVLLGLVLNMTEPLQKSRNEALSVFVMWRSLRTALRQPVLTWLFAVSALMYTFNHIPFVFGQPFVLEALDKVGLAGEAPVISGAVTATMMGISVFASIFAPRLRLRFGLMGMVLLGFGMQICLVAVLGVTNAAPAIAFLFLRMVPDAFSRPFIIARIQPELSRENRATYFSVVSLVSKLIFAGTLSLAAGSSAARDAMVYAEIQLILGGYAMVGCVAFALLVIAARRLPDTQAQHGKT